MTDGPDGRPVWAYSHDVNGNLKSVIDPDNRKTEHVYDAVNLRRETKLYAVGAGVPSSTEKFANDNRGNLVAVVDPRGVALGQESAITSRSRMT